MGCFKLVIFLCFGMQQNNGEKYEVVPELWKYVRHNSKHCEENKAESHCGPWTQIYKEKDVHY